MKDKYIELKQNRDFGEIITIYFEFFKQNLKNFTSIFLRYNGIFILAFLGISYLMVTGFMGLVASGDGLFSNNVSPASISFLGLGILAFFIVFLIVGALNYSLSSAYMIEYEKEKSSDVNTGPVWNRIKHHTGNIILFMILLIVLYVAVGIFGVIIGLIPFIGTIIYYMAYYALIAWLGVSFMSMLHENKSATDALSEGWKLMTKSFWKSMGVNFIIGLLVGILLILILTIPGILIGVYTFHAVDTNVDIANSATARIIYTLGTCMLLIAFAYSQAIMQFVNGVLYFSLHEKEYNVNTREKISQIGENE